MKIYCVYHNFDVDGGFGDAIDQSEVVAVFEKEEDAKAFVDKYHDPCVYDRPYHELWHHCLSITEIDIISHNEFDINKKPDEYPGSCW